MSVTDYYAILGVLPSAEDIVIKAAYKALVQRYHPDRYKGDANEANSKMQDLNAAFAILSDPIKRKEYDRNWSAGATESNEAFDEGGLDNEGESEAWEEEWKYVLDFYPDLEKISAKLSSYSWYLSQAYKIAILQKKNFPERYNLARQMEEEFLRRYFGENPKIREFARQLLVSKQKTVARELNKAVAKLGDDSDAYVIIRRIVQKYPECSFRDAEDEDDVTFSLLVGSAVIGVMVVTFLVLSFAAGS